MQLLLDDRLAPITKEIGFLEAECAVAVRTFTDWLEALQRDRGVSLTTRAVSGCLDEVLQTLLPLTSLDRRRFLFVPTASPWVAYFDNSYRGTDATGVMAYLARLIGCRGLRIVAVPNTIRGTGMAQTGRYGAVMLELYGPHDTDWLNYVRTIAAANDGGRWVFQQSGTPFPFEDIERYNARRVKDRFTFEMLQQYAQELGLAPFDESFYLPPSDNTAMLVEKQGPTVQNLREYTLADVAREVLRTTPHSTWL